MRLSYLLNRKPNAGEMPSTYWDASQYYFNGNWEILLLHYLFINP